ncbi:glycerophosphodiester phosphodiesterase family protein [Rhizohabitans arisaemae]|uniref:glycerophosphodiester phosphodiesterase family protein n=1 Tax=Rhizohabitans arisaemae TaxID=2720610 RepID=UPI0024B1E346|nr:glycerophosphodiester phosphodiesterase family protein [Rhizohabitans arisaemae]
MPHPVELHGHRGARGLRPENTLPGLAHAMEIGVDALEFDVAMTADRQIVLTHDLTVSAVTSADTAPAVPGDPFFPFVGRPIAELTLAQLRTLECGVRLPRGEDDVFAATQIPVPGTRMPTLGAALGLVAAYGADRLQLNVEIKSDPTRPELTADPWEITELVTAELTKHRRMKNVALLSFDWRILLAASRIAPAVPRYANVEARTLAPGTRWLAGLDPDRFNGNVALAARSIGANVLSVDHSLITEELAASADGQALPVVAWTVNDPGDAKRLIDLGVRALVTDYPDRMHEVLTERGLPVPAPIRLQVGGGRRS